MDKSSEHLLSEKRKSVTGRRAKTRKVTGTETIRVKSIPEETTIPLFRLFPSSRFLIIVLETVIGIPDEVIVINSPRTERAI